MAELPPAAHRVETAARELGLAIAIRAMPDSTRTAAEAATAVGATVGQIVKSLVFKAKQTGRPLLFLVSGANRVNEKAVGERLGEPIVRPDADLCARPPVSPSAAFRLSATQRRSTPFSTRTCCNTRRSGRRPGHPTGSFRSIRRRLREACSARVISVR